MFDVVELDNQLKVQLSSDVNLVENVVALLSKFVSEVPEDKIFAIDIIVKELLINAIEHGNKGDFDQSIEFICDRLPNRILIQVEDSGEGFDYRSHNWVISEDEVEVAQLRHRGLALVNEYADILEFNQKGNKVSAWINLKQDLSVHRNENQELVEIGFVGNLGAQDVEQINSILAEELQDQRALYFDFEQVDEMDSLALGVFLSFGYQVHLDQPEKPLYIVNPNHEIRVLLKFVHADKFYTIELAKLEASGE